MTKRDCTTTPTFAPYPVGCIPKGLPVLDLADDLFMVLQHNGQGLANAPAEFKQTMAQRVDDYRTQIQHISRLLNVAAYRLEKVTATNTCL